MRTAATAMGLVLFAGTVKAALFVLPDERFVYDSALDITWLRDANAAKGTAFDQQGGSSPNDGALYFSAANNWAQSLSFTVSGQVVDGWRLPRAVEVPPTDNFFNGSSTTGYNITRPSSEMSHLFYVTLSNQGLFDPAGNGPQAGAGLSNAGPFLNVQQGIYWTETIYSATNTPNPVNHYPFTFDFSTGRQEIYWNQSERFAWAVHPGNVMSPVPEPSALALILAGSAAVFWKTRRRATG